MFFNANRMKRRNSFDNFQLAASSAASSAAEFPIASPAAPPEESPAAESPAAESPAAPSEESPVAESSTTEPGPNHSTITQRLTHRFTSNTQAHSVSLLQDPIIDQSRIFYHINFQLFIHYDNDQQNADYYRSFFIIGKDYIFGPNGPRVGQCEMISLNPINGCRSIRDIMINVVRSPIDLTLSFQTVGQGTISIGGSVTIHKMSM